MSAPPPALLRRDQLLLAASVFAACLIGIASRPAGYSASVWVSNALLIGLLLRNPALARRPATWLLALAAYLAADLATGARGQVALAMNACNLAGVAAGWRFLAREGQAVLGFTRQRSVLQLLAGCAVAALASALPGAVVTQHLFATRLETAFLMWLSSEAYNLLLILPVVLAAPQGWFWQWDLRRLPAGLPSRSPWPLLALLASEALASAIDGPGVLGFSVPALVWCAMAYGIFPTTLLNLLLCSWKTAVFALGAFSFVPDQLAAVASFRIGIALLSLAPLAVAVSQQLRTQTLARLQRAVHYDDLTGALSRPTLMERATRQIQRLQHEGAPVSVLLIDLDHFKQINDRHGHAQGDAVLRDFSALVQSQLRPDDLFGRVGGEEFALILPRTSAAQAHAVAERLRVLLRQSPMPLPSGAELALTFSAGLRSAEPPTPQDSLEQLLAQADAALYQAKAEGRDQLRGYRAAPLS